MEIGDRVEVLDPGLLMLQKFASPDNPPNNVGWIRRFMENGDALIEFPIGNDPIEEHSQAAPYPLDIIRKIE